MKLTFTLVEQGRYGEYTELSITDESGKRVGSGGFGGEPEDNTEGRSYYWVVPLLETLARMPACEVEIVRREATEDDE